MPHRLGRRIATRPSQSQYPELWRGLRFYYAPALGRTGPVLPQFAPTQTGPSTFRANTQTAVAWSSSPWGQSVSFTKDFECGFPFPVNSQTCYTTSQFQVLVDWDYSSVPTTAGCFTWWWGLTTTSSSRNGFGWFPSTSKWLWRTRSPAAAATDDLDMTGLVATNTRYRMVFTYDGTTKTVWDNGRPIISAASSFTGNVGMGDANVGGGFPNGVQVSGNANCAMKVRAFAFWDRIVNPRLLSQDPYALFCPRPRVWAPTPPPEATVAGLDALAGYWSGTPSVVTIGTMFDLATAGAPGVRLFCDSEGKVGLLGTGGPGDEIRSMESYAGTRHEYLITFDGVSSYSLYIDNTLIGSVTGTAGTLTRVALGNDVDGTSPSKIKVHQAFILNEAL